MVIDSTDTRLGIGVIVRDHMGYTIAVRSHIAYFVFEPMIAKAIAVLSATEFSHDLTL
jgi:hypothetical protein